MQIVFEPPSKDSPGFLRRMKQALSFQDAIRDKRVSEQTVDNMIGFLSHYIKVPEDREEVKNLLLDASEVQFNEMLESITGRKTEDNTKKNGNGLDSGSRVAQTKRRLKHSS